MDDHTSQEHVDPNHGESTGGRSKPNRKRLWLSLTILTLIIVGILLAKGSGNFNSRAARLRPGMTKDEVISVMGNPDRLLKLSNVEIALYTPYPFDFHAILTKPGPTLAGKPYMATEFPAYIEFRDDIAVRVRVNGNEVEDMSKAPVK